MGNAKGEELLKTLHAEVVKLVTGDDWRHQLDIARGMHNYSWGNIMLIGSQRPDASKVAGYQRWQDLGRQVRKGSKAIWILAPMIVNKPDPDKPGTKRQVLIGFRGATVFALEDTDGPDLPPDMPILEGEAPEGMLATVEEAIKAEGFTVEYKAIGGGPEGFTDHKARKVVLKEGRDPAMSAMVGLHELAHVKMHKPEDLESEGGYAVCRGRCEIEAQSVAYVVGSEMGLDAGGITFHYVGTWSEGEPEKITKTGNAVLKTSKAIMEGITERAAVVAA